jgi:hypothetical protein
MQVSTVAKQRVEVAHNVGGTAEQSEEGTSPPPSTSDGGGERQHHHHRSGKIDVGDDVTRTSKESS